jgi:threonine/homoserine/homoserine lactone efflux protein
MCQARGRFFRFFSRNLQYPPVLTRAVQGHILDFPEGVAVFPWISFLPYMVIMAYTPGPNNIMSMNNAKTVGFRKGLPFNFGVFAGFLLVMLLCLLFSTALYTVVPKIQIPMKILGASYMVYLSVNILIKTFGSSKKREIKNANAGFLIAMALQLINPKIIIGGLTAMPAYILPYYSGNIPMLLFFAFLLAFIGFSGTVCWAAFGSLFSVLFNKHGKILNVTMAALLLYCAVSLFL